MRRVLATRVSYMLAIVAAAIAVPLIAQVPGDTCPAGSQAGCKCELSIEVTDSSGGAW